MSLRDHRQLCGHPLTYVTARVLLAGDAVARKEYIELRALHEAFHCHQHLETTHTEPRFRALLTEGDAKHLALEWT